MKRLTYLLMIACLALTLCACVSPERTTLSPLSGAEATQPIISAQPEDAAQREREVTLYFRNGDTSLLRQETRRITYSPNETPEKAMVTALLEGASTGSASPLFPENTRVLSTQTQDGIVYVTLSEALYDRYGGDDDLFLRRRLAMAALAATLTETGDAHAVQVLVRSEKNVGASMRLSGDFLGLSDPLILPPLTREDTYLPTPGAYGRALLSAWQHRDWSDLVRYVSRRGESLSPGQFEKAQVLTDFALGEATLSPDGSAAVLTVTLTLQPADGFGELTAVYPLHLVREEGAWLASAAPLVQLMGEIDD